MIHHRTPETDVPSTYSLINRVGTSCLATTRYTGRGRVSKTVHLSGTVKCCPFGSERFSIYDRPFTVVEIRHHEEHLLKFRGLKFSIREGTGRPGGVGAADVVDVARSQIPKER